MQRTTLAEVADTTAFIASDRADAMTATVTNLSAGSITRPVVTGCTVISVSHW